MYRIRARHIPIRVGPPSPDLDADHPYALRASSSASIVDDSAHGGLLETRWSHTCVPLPWLCNSEIDAVLRLAEAPTLRVAEFAGRGAQVGGMVVAV